MHTQYFVFIHRPGPNWLQKKPVTEQPLEEHFAYMDQLAAQGKLVLGGGFLDGAGAMGVLRTDTIDKARVLAEQDPSVMAAIVTTEVHPWLVTVGAIESP
jgi:uncharacterized protein YciI